MAKSRSRKQLMGLGALALSMMGACEKDSSSPPVTPGTTYTVRGEIPPSSVSNVDKIDLLLMIDNSISMGEKQAIFAETVPHLVSRLTSPICSKASLANPSILEPAKCTEAGAFLSNVPIKDIHIGILSSSLGGHGGDACKEGDPQNPNNNDRARLITRTPVGTTPATVPTHEAGFLVWAPALKASDAELGAERGKLTANFKSLVRGAGETGCGFEASLESWYRFLIDPDPPLSVTTAKQNGADSYSVPVVVSKETDTVLLQQRADFLRPDSLVGVIVLSDENDCSIIDGVLPASVCRKPVVDESGKPLVDASGKAQCQVPREPWPTEYQIERNYSVNGGPFAFNHRVSYLAAELIGGTAACKADPYSEECKECLTKNSAPGCPPTPNPAKRSIDDHNNLRCWNQKQRFGWDALYPLQRYVDGLTSAQVYDRHGNLVQNPLFDDLPYNVSLSSGTSLGREKLPPRDQSLVLFEAIVGVPWQDIAKDPNDLSKGYLPVSPDDTGKAVDFELIVGDPNNPDQAKRKLPSDPLMVEEIDRSSLIDEKTLHPVTKESLDPSKPNRFNGHEQTLLKRDHLQYACTFALPPSAVKDSTFCLDAEANHDPLCQENAAGPYTKKRYAAGAYPGTRFLSLVKSLADRGRTAIPASICAANVDSSKSEQDDYAYKPAISALSNALQTKRSSRCLPVGQLPVDQAGRSNGVVIEIQEKPSPCEICKGPKRKAVDSAIAALPEFRDRCLCEVVQLEGPDQIECQTELSLSSLTSAADRGGWCYINPDRLSAENAAKAKTILSAYQCQAIDRSTLRFVNADVENSYLFVLSYLDLGFRSLVLVSKGELCSARAIMNQSLVVIEQSQELMVVQQKEMLELLGVETRNKYSIEANGSRIAYAAEQGVGALDMVARMFFGHWRTFEIHFFDLAKQVVFRAVHPFRFFFQRLEVLDSSGRLFGAIQQRFAFLYKRFDVEDANGSALLTVSSSPFSPWTFVFERQGQEVARIEKKWSGMLTEMFTDADRFRVSLAHPSLTLVERQLLLAAAIFIDLQYFEKKS